eukprot:2952465-Alexandrium_andersonii.AAC.1
MGGRCVCARHVPDQCPRAQRRWVNEQCNPFTHACFYKHWLSKWLDRQLNRHTEMGAANNGSNVWSLNLGWQIELTPNGRHD